MNTIKVGNKLVAKDYSNPCEVFFEVDRIGKNGEVYDSRWRMLYIEKFRHATEAEIEVGHRLDQPTLN